MLDKTTVEKNVASVVNDALLQYKSNRQGTALSYIRLARKLASSGISRTRALQLVADNFPAEHKAFLAAQERGEKLPVLFPKAGESYETRRARALARGGVIG